MKASQQRIARHLCAGLLLTLAAPQAPARADLWGGWLQQVWAPPPAPEPVIVLPPAVPVAEPQLPIFPVAAAPVIPALPVAAPVPDLQPPIFPAAAAPAPAPAPAIPALPPAAPAPDPRPPIFAAAAAPAAPAMPALPPAAPAPDPVRPAVDHVALAPVATGQRGAGVSLPQAPNASPRLAVPEALPKAAPAVDPDKTYLATQALRPAATGRAAALPAAARPAVPQPVMAGFVPASAPAALAAPAKPGTIAALPPAAPAPDPVRSPGMARPQQAVAAAPKAAAGSAVPRRAQSQAAPAPAVPLGPAGSLPASSLLPPNFRVQTVNTPDGRSVFVSITEEGRLRIRAGMPLDHALFLGMDSDSESVRAWAAKRDAAGRPLYDMVIAVNWGGKGSVLERVRVVTAEFDAAADVRAVRSAFQNMFGRANVVANAVDTHSNGTATGVGSVRAGVVVIPRGGDLTLFAPQPGHDSQYTRAIQGVHGQVYAGTADLVPVSGGIESRAGAALVGLVSGGGAGALASAVGPVNTGKQMPVMRYAGGHDLETALAARAAQLDPRQRMPK